MAKFARLSSRRHENLAPSAPEIEDEAQLPSRRVADALTRDSLELFDYFGDPRTLDAGDIGVRIGVPPDTGADWEPVGEKLVLRGVQYDDLEIAVDVTPTAGRGFDSGVLFRVTDCGIGFDRQRGYFAGVVLAENRIIIGKTDGIRWAELNRVVPRTVIPARFRLRVRAAGKQILVYLLSLIHI